MLHTIISYIIQYMYYIYYIIQYVYYISRIICTVYYIWYIIWYITYKITYHMKYTVYILLDTYNYSFPFRENWLMQPVTMYSLVWCWDSNSGLWYVLPALPIPKVNTSEWEHLEHRKAAWNSLLEIRRKASFSLPPQFPGPLQAWVALWSVQYKLAMPCKALL